MLNSHKRLYVADAVIAQVQGLQSVSRPKGSDVGDFVFADVKRPQRFKKRKRAEIAYPITAEMKINEIAE